MASTTKNDPQISKPEDLFRSITYYIGGKVPDEVGRLLEKGKAKAYGEICDFVTHLIVGPGVSETDLEQAKDVYQIPVCRYEWILHSDACGKLLSESLFSVESPLHVFAGCHVFLCHRTEAALSSRDLAFLWGLLTTKGGRVARSLGEPGLTHAVFKKADGPLYSSAASHSSISVVTPDYLLDCVRHGKLIDPLTYHPRLLVKTPPPVPPTQRTAPPPGVSRPSHPPTAPLPQTLPRPQLPPPQRVPTPTSSTVGSKSPVKPPPSPRPPAAVTDEERKAALLDQLKQRMPWNNPQQQDNRPRHPLPQQTIPQQRMAAPMAGSPIRNQASFQSSARPPSVQRSKGGSPRYSTQQSMPPPSSPAPALSPQRPPTPQSPSSPATTPPHGQGGGNIPPHLHSQIPGHPGGARHMGVSSRGTPSPVSSGLPHPQSPGGEHLAQLQVRQREQMLQQQALRQQQMAAGQQQPVQQQQHLVTSQQGMMPPPASLPHQAGTSIVVSQGHAPIQGQRYESGVRFISAREALELRRQAKVIDRSASLGIEYPQSVAHPSSQGTGTAAPTMVQLHQPSSGQQQTMMPIQQQTWVTSAQGQPRYVQQQQRPDHYPTTSQQQGMGGMALPPGGHRQPGQQLSYPMHSQSQQVHQVQQVSPQQAYQQPPRPVVTTQVAAAIPTSQQQQPMVEAITLNPAQQTALQQSLANQQQQLVHPKTKTALANLLNTRSHQQPPSQTPVQSTVQGMGIQQGGYPHPATMAPQSASFAATGPIAISTAGTGQLQHAMVSSSTQQSPMLSPQLVPQSPGHFPQQSGPMGPTHLHQQFSPTPHVSPQQPRAMLSPQGQLSPHHHHHALQRAQVAPQGQLRGPPPRGLPHAHPVQQAALIRQPMPPQGPRGPPARFGVRPGVSVVAGHRPAGPQHVARHPGPSSGTTAPVPHKMTYYGHDPNLKLPAHLSLLGCTFAFQQYEDFREKGDFPHWERIIRSFGGEVLQEPLAPKVNLILCQWQDDTIKEFPVLINCDIIVVNPHLPIPQALKEGKRCVTYRWLEDVVLREAPIKVHPPWMAVHLPVAFDLASKPYREFLICITGWEDVERRRVQQMVDSLGAQYSSYLHKEVHFLICKKPEGEKFRKAREWRIPTVNILFLSDLMLGDPSGLAHPRARKYVDFYHEDPFRIEGPFAGQIMLPWKTPIPITAQDITRVHSRPLPRPPLKRRPPQGQIPSCPLHPPPPKKAKGAGEEDGADSNLPRVILARCHRGRLDQLVVNLKGSVSLSARDATHYVVPEPFRRSHTFMCALSACKFLVTRKWVEDSFQAKRWLDEVPYFPQDPEFDREWGCDLKRLLLTPRRNMLFKVISLVAPLRSNEEMFRIFMEEHPEPALLSLPQGKTFFLTPSVQPTRRQLQEIIECAGGTVVKRRFGASKIKELNTPKRSSASTSSKASSSTSKGSGSSSKGSKGSGNGKQPVMKIASACSLQQTLDAVIAEAARQAAQDEASKQAASSASTASTTSSTMTTSGQESGPSRPPPLSSAVLSTLPALTHSIRTPIVSSSVESSELSSTALPPKPPPAPVKKVEVRLDPATGLTVVSGTPPPPSTSSSSSVEALPPPTAPQRVPDAPPSMPHIKEEVLDEPPEAMESDSALPTLEPMDTDPPETAAAVKEEADGSQPAEGSKKLMDQVDGANDEPEAKEETTASEASQEETGETVDQEMPRLVSSEEVVSTPDTRASSDALPQLLSQVPEWPTSQSTPAAEESPLSLPPLLEPLMSSAPPITNRQPEFHALSSSGVRSHPVPPPTQILPNVGRSQPSTTSVSATATSLSQFISSLTSGTGAPTTTFSSPKWTSSTSSPASTSAPPVVPLIPSVDSSSSAKVSSSEGRESQEKEMTVGRKVESEVEPMTSEGQSTTVASASTSSGQIQAVVSSSGQAEAASSSTYQMQAVTSSSQIQTTTVQTLTTVRQLPANCPTDSGQIASLTSSQGLSSSVQAQAVSSSNHTQTITSSSQIQAVASSSGQPVSSSGQIQATVSSNRVQPVVSSGHMQLVSSSGQQPAVSSGHAQPVVSSGHMQLVSSSGQQPAVSSGHGQPVVSSGHMQPVTSSDQQPAASADHIQLDTNQRCQQVTCKQVFRQVNNQWCQLAAYNQLFHLVNYQRFQLVMCKQLFHQVNNQRCHQATFQRQLLVKYIQLPRQVNNQRHHQASHPCHQVTRNPLPCQITCNHSFRRAICNQLLRQVTNNQLFHQVNNQRCHQATYEQQCHLVKFKRRRQVCRNQCLLRQVHTAMSSANQTLGHVRTVASSGQLQASPLTGQIQLNKSGMTSVSQIPVQTMPLSGQVLVVGGSQGQPTTAGQLLRMTAAAAFGSQPGTSASVGSLVSSQVSGADPSVRALGTVPSYAGVARTSVPLTPPPPSLTTTSSVRTPIPLTSTISIPTTIKSQTVQSEIPTTNVTQPVARSSSASPVRPLMAALDRSMSLPSPKPKASSSKSKASTSGVRRTPPPAAAASTKTNYFVIGSEKDFCLLTDMMRLNLPVYCEEMVLSSILQHRIIEEPAYQLDYSEYFSEKVKKLAAHGSHILMAAQIGVFGLAVHSLSRVGDDIYVHFAGDNLTLKAIDAAHSVYACFRFNRLFFATLDDPNSMTMSASITSTAPQKPVSECKVTTKSLLVAFRNVAALEKSVERCTLRLDWQSCKLHFTFAHRKSVTKTISVPIVESSRLAIREASRDAPNAVSSLAKPMRESLVMLTTGGAGGRRSAELTITSTNDGITFTNYSDDDPEPGNSVHSSMKVPAGFFDEFRVEEEGSVTFNLRDLKTALSFSEQTSYPTRILFGTSLSSLICQVNCPPTFEAAFVLATIATDDMDQEQADAVSQAAALPPAPAPSSSVRLTRPPSRNKDPHNAAGGNKKKGAQPSAIAEEAEGRRDSVDILEYSRTSESSASVKPTPSVRPTPTPPSTMAKQESTTRSTFMKKRGRETQENTPSGRQHSAHTAPHQTKGSSLPQKNLRQVMADAEQPDALNEPFEEEAEACMLSASGLQEPLPRTLLSAVVARSSAARDVVVQPSTQVLTPRRQPRLKPLFPGRRPENAEVSGWTSDGEGN
ncbi:unnamed protein product [Cyprideis torosa]|uniref:PAX-interacting protein 1 n=1 Tax=Cyprideis torosa TaxID=163714 RepID=A0A7R8WEF4_9CRUS|nr:unnamed protein product [Cyprideis torosa]CAG0889419.1 unnamed protein product [Cyprideis torosa]